MDAGQGKWVKPDYGGGGLVNLVASIAARFGHRTGHPVLRILPPSRLSRYKKIVLVVLDGLGWKFLERQGEAGFLKSRLSGRMTSVFPSTTASAVATLATGATPLEHGVTGWFTFLRELGSVAKILFSQPRHGGAGYPQTGVPMRRLILSPPMYRKLKAKCLVVAPEEIISSDFTQTTSAGAGLIGYRSLAGFCMGIERALESGTGPTLVSAYWPELDGICHHHGTGSRQAWEHYLELAASLQRLCSRFSGGEILFLITADHGLADTPAGRFIDLGRHPQLSDCLTLPLCGEPRLAYCYVHPDRKTFFLRYITKRLGRAARLYDQKTLIDGGYFGPGKPEPWFRHRVGDYVLAMKQGWSLRDFLPNEERSLLKAAHGGMSPEEMLVPLIVSG
jgi:hypothetical protein